MAWTYSCPLCDSVVNPDETIILLASRQDVTILLGFHPQPGNYTIYLPPGCEMRVGDRWHFYCPVCRQNLISKEHENLCSLTAWQGEDRREGLFSRVVGEKATYVITESEVEATHGDDSKTYEKTIPRFRIDKKRGTIEPF